MKTYEPRREWRERRVPHLRWRAAQIAKTRYTQIQGSLNINGGIERRHNIFLRNIFTVQRNLLHRLISQIDSFIYSCLLFKWVKSCSYLSHLSVVMETHSVVRFSELPVVKSNGRLKKKRWQAIAYGTIQQYFHVISTEIAVAKLRHCICLVR